MSSSIVANVIAFLLVSNCSNERQSDVTPGRFERLPRKSNLTRSTDDGLLMAHLAAITAYY